MQLFDEVAERDFSAAFAHDPGDAESVRAFLLGAKAAVACHHGDFLAQGHNALDERERFFHGAGADVDVDVLGVFDVSAL